MRSAAYPVSSRALSELDHLPNKTGILSDAEEGAVGDRLLVGILDTTVLDQSPV